MENWKDFNEIENVTINPSKINTENFNFAGRNVVAHFENKQKRHKIKLKKSFEQQIDEESKNVTINSLVTGVAALGAITCFSIATGTDIEIAQRVGTLFLGVASSKGLYDSVKVLAESMKRKTKLENTYFDTYGEEYEGKKR